MNRTITTERLYSLGDYKNIRFSDTIAELPEELMLRPELIAKLRYLQLVEMEIMVNKYLIMSKEIMNKSPEVIIGLLEENKIQTLAIIKQLLNGKTQDTKLQGE